MGQVWVSMRYKGAGSLIFKKSAPILAESCWHDRNVETNWSLKKRTQKSEGLTKSQRSDSNRQPLVYKEQARYEEAEPLLLEAANGSIEKLGLQYPQTQKSIKTLIKLYEVWNKPEQANHWRAKLSQTEAVEQ